MEESGENARPGMSGGEQREEAAAGSGQGASEGGQARGGASDMEDEVRRRAYELYVARGGEPGREFDDWYAAEREVRGRRAAGGRGEGPSSRGPDAEPRSGMGGTGGMGEMGSARGMGSADGSAEGMGEASPSGGQRAATPRKRSAPARRGRSSGEG